MTVMLNKLSLNIVSQIQTMSDLACPGNRSSDGTKARTLNSNIRPLLECPMLEGAATS